MLFGVAAEVTAAGEGHVTAYVAARKAVDISVGAGKSGIGTGAGSS